MTAGALVCLAVLVLLFAGLSRLPGGPEDY